jgi:hypothetical protein
MDQQETNSFNWKEFSQRTWVVVVSGLVFPPLGIFLSWRKPDWTPKAKWVATGLMGLLLIGRMGGGEKKEHPENGKKAEATASVSIASDSSDSDAGDRKEGQKYSSTVSKSQQTSDTVPAGKGANQSGSTIAEQVTGVSAGSETNNPVPEDRKGYEGFAAEIRSSIKQSERELEESARKADRARAELEAGRPREMNETSWELRRDSLRMVLDNYAKEKQSHEEKVQGYLNYKTGVEQEHKEAALAATRAQEKRERMLKEQEAVNTRVAAMRQSRKAPQMDAKSAQRKGYAEGWEDGVTLAYEWLDRVQQQAKGKRIEQYLQENPLEIADAEEKVHSLRNGSLALLQQRMHVLDSLIRRGITIGLDHPDAAAADRRCSYAQGKAEGYVAVVFPVIHPAKDGK